MCGIALLVWAVFWNRNRGSFTCPKCWYSLDATPPFEREGQAVRRCPECARETSDAKLKIFRKRRWGWATIAVLLILLGGSATAWPSVQSRGWSLISTRWLVELVPIGGYDGPFGQELMRRLGMTPPRGWSMPPAASPDEIAFVVQRAAAGNLLAHPLSARWKDSYGRIILAARETVFSSYFYNWQHNLGLKPINDSWKALYDIPPELHIRTRSRWPEGVPIWVEMSVAEYWPFRGLLGISIEPKGREVQRLGYPYLGFTMDAMPLGAGDIQFDASISKTILTPELGEGASHTVFEGARKLQLRYRVIGTIDEIMTPVESPALGSLLEAGQYTFNRGWVMSDFPPIHGGPAEGIAFGLMLEFHLDGKLMARQRVWWDGSSPPTGTERKLATEWIDLDPPPSGFKSPWSARSDEHWTIKARSDPETALRVIDCDRYWKGEIEIPMVVIDPDY